MKELYISVDVESSGPIPGKFSLLSIGACVVESPEQDFYVEIAPISDEYVPEAMKVIGKDLDHFRTNGSTPLQAMKEFGSWVARCKEVDENPVFVGFNAVFDWSFVNWYFHQYVGDNPFGIGGIDIKSFYMGMAGSSFADTTASSLPGRFKPKQPHTHNALDDAKGQAETFAEMQREGSRKTS